MHTDLSSCIYLKEDVKVQNENFTFVIAKYGVPRERYITKYYWYLYLLRSKVVEWSALKENK